MSTQAESLEILICREISDCGGSIDFARFMELALYARGLGYYENSGPKFGPDGDFITAPEISPLFGRCLARTAAAVLKQLSPRTILEFGAGTGSLAGTLIQELEYQGCALDRYFILEVSSELRSRQKLHLSQVVPHVYPRIEWLTTLPANQFSGLVIANEVIDAMPVHRIEIGPAEVSELCVSHEHQRFVWTPRPILDTRLKSALTDVLRLVGTGRPSPYRTEVNLLLEPWIASLADRLQEGAILCLDYGYHSTDYYHPERSDGTLICHYRHRVHSDPFILIGQQDITASVDFSALANAAIKNALEVSGYTHMADYLIASGLLDLLGEAQQADSTNYSAAVKAVKTLLLPGEMGERFKVMLLTRKLQAQELTAGWHDQRFKL